MTRMDAERQAERLNQRKDGFAYAMCADINASSYHVGKFGKGGGLVERIYNAIS